MGSLCCCAPPGEVNEVSLIWSALMENLAYITVREEDEWRFEVACPKTGDKKTISFKHGEKFEFKWERSGKTAFMSSNGGTIRHYTTS